MKTQHVIVKVKLEVGAHMPSYAHPTDIGADIKAWRTWLVQGDGTEHELNTPEDIRRAYMMSLDCAKIKIDTGVHVTPQDGYYIELVPNSRLAKTPFMYANSFGVIDPTYTGSMRVILNCVNRLTPDDMLTFMPGKVVGQLIIRERIPAAFEQVEELEATERGDGGFGSTEKKRPETPCDTCIHGLDSTMLHISHACNECKNFVNYRAVSTAGKGDA